MDFRWMNFFTLNEKTKVAFGGVAPTNHTLKEFWKVKVH